jgi:hypothetical protein
MEIKVSAKADFLPFGSFHFQFSSLGEKEENDEIERLKERLTWPYELREGTAALRGPVSIWGTSG